MVSPLRVSGFSSQYLATDVEYLHRISCDQTIHGDFTLEMAIRGTCSLSYTYSIALGEDCLKED